MRSSGESPIRSNKGLPWPVRRRHVAGLRPLGVEEWSQWVPDANGGGGWYAPLSTKDEATAKARGMELAARVARKGWDEGTEAREFTLAVFWLEAPLACTYTTLFAGGRDGRMRVGGRGVGLRVAVVEKDPVFRTAIVRAMGTRDGCEPSGHPDMEGARRVAGVDVVLVNRAQGESGVPRRQGVRREGGGMLVLPYGIYPTSDHIFMSFSGLDAGYLLRRRGIGALLEPLDGAFFGGRLAREEAGRSIRRYCQGLFHDSAGVGQETGRGSLTMRQRQVLAGLQRGLHDKEIAAELGISPLTVHTHLKHVFEKLGARTRTEAVVKFLEK